MNAVPTLPEARAKIGYAILIALELLALVVWTLGGPTTSVGAAWAISAVVTVVLFVVHFELGRLLNSKSQSALPLSALVSVCGAFALFMSLQGRSTVITWGALILLEVLAFELSKGRSRQS